MPQQPVSFIQMAGSALNLAPHFHLIFIDGIFSRDTTGSQKFHPCPPTENESIKVLKKIVTKTIKVLSQKGYLISCTYLDDEVYIVPEKFTPWKISDLIAAALWPINRPSEIAKGKVLGDSLVKLSSALQVEYIATVSHSIADAR